jgi:Domain of unknown function (DUF4177)
MRKWEYQHWLQLDLDFNELDGRLATYGEQGWELVGMTRTDIAEQSKRIVGFPTGILLIFKRPAQ